MAKDLFIHHFGSRTFAGNGIDAAALLEENARRFADKWGQDVPIGRRVSLRAWALPDRPQVTRDRIGKDPGPQITQRKEKGTGRKRGRN